MGYFLGKDNPGNLSSVLSGAYNASSPTTPPPINSGQPTPPPNPLTNPTGPGDTSKGPKCFQECRAKYKDTGTPEFDRCFDECMAGQDPGGTTCDDAHPCVTGECIQGHCVVTQDQECDATHVCTPPKVCVGGVCVEPPPCNPPCVAPKVCVSGQCVDPGTTCPEGSGGTALEGCPCGTLYNTKTGKCATGYKFVKRNNNGVRDDWAKEINPTPGAIGTCECEKWITPGSGAGRLGEYKFPPEMQQLMDMLLARGKEFLGMPLGLSQDAQDKQFGRNFENIRGAEAGQRASLEQGLSRQGMLGTGERQGMLNDLSWQTEGNVANTARDLFIQNELKKKQDMLDYSGAARDMLGSGMNFQQLLEAINSARRGEGAASMQALLAWLLANYG